MGITEIRLEIRTRRYWIELYPNFFQFSSINFPMFLVTKQNFFSKNCPWGSYTLFHKNVEDRVCTKIKNFFQITFWPNVLKWQKMLYENIVCHVKLEKLSTFVQKIHKFLFVKPVFWLNISLFSVKKQKLNFSAGNGLIFTHNVFSNYFHHNKFKKVYAF